MPAPSSPGRSARCWWRAPAGTTVRDLAALLTSWEGGALTVLLRKRIGRHLESCPTCAEREREQVRPAALFSAYAGLPILAVPAGAVAAGGAHQLRAGRDR